MTLRPGDAVRIRDEPWRVLHVAPHGEASLLDVAGTGDGNRGARARFLLPFEPVNQLTCSDTPRVVRRTEWRRLARATLSAATPSTHSLRSVARASIDLVSYQLEPALAFTTGRAARMLIADDVGLGKTIQAGIAIGELLAREPDARVFVVCPAGLREQWQLELRDRFAIHAAIMDAAGTARSTAAHGVAINPWTTERVLIASIDYVKRPEIARALALLIWDLVVFDEAHALSGPSDRAAAAAALGRRARRLILLTATPHSGDDAAFQRMCGIGRLGDDDALVIFRRTRADVGTGGRRRTKTMRVTPAPAEAAVHRALMSYARRVWQQAASGSGGHLAMSVLIRRACSSAASLARSLTRRLLLLGTPDDSAGQLLLPFVDLSADDDEPLSLLAAPALAALEEERGVLTPLLALAQRAARHESKIAFVRRLLRRAGEPAIVFTEYRDTLVHLASQLQRRAVLLHGGMTAADRRTAIAAFTSGRVDLLLATDAASEGLNLHQRCRLVINLELPWTPLRLEQRTGRVDRIGQQRTVHALNLVARGTDEEAVRSRLRERRSKAEASLDGLGVNLRELAIDEARWIATARALMPRVPFEPGRPSLCTFRGRADAARGRYWIWNLTLTTADGRLLWRPLLAMTTAVGTDQAARSLLEGVVRDTRDALVVLDRRERAIARLLTRPAAAVQPGLFDRRAERDATRRTTLLEEALATSHRHLLALEAARNPQLDERRLVFAVTIR